MARLKNQVLIAGSISLLALFSVTKTEAAEIVEHNKMMDHGDGHMMDMDGAMVMGQNRDKLPPGCSKISEDAEITVTASHKYSKEFPGTMFGFSEHEWKVKPCTRLTVHFINEDNVRHQWMMHGLPKFLYDKGMFHLEVTGPGKVSGTLILPVEDRTYLVHCDIAQHMEKGMKGQLVVGNGSNPFPSIPGVTNLAIPDNYAPAVKPELSPANAAVASNNSSSASSTPSTVVESKSTESSTKYSGLFYFGFLLGAVGFPFAFSSYQKRMNGKSQDEIKQILLNESRGFIDNILGIVNKLVNQFRKNS